MFTFAASGPAALCGPESLNDISAGPWKTSITFPRWSLALDLGLERLLEEAAGPTTKAAPHCGQVVTFSTSP
jgi:hypothetical protein